MTTLISIIIPCYNQGHFLQDALDSIETSSIKLPVEIIIVNDGSTDEDTISKMNVLSFDSRFIVINQQNTGLASARNAGIAASKGKYILPLDADNKIMPSYINKAVEILERGEYDIVYGKPVFFGENQKKRMYKPRPFDEYSLLEGNFIDACAMFNKLVWSRNGGYDNQMPVQGYEDWEFWISAFGNGYKFYFLEEEAFYYRVVSNSMMDLISEEKLVIIHKYLFNKHQNIFLYSFVKLCYIKRKYETDMRAWLITPIKYILYKMRLKTTPQQKAENIFRKYL